MSIITQKFIWKYYLSYFYLNLKLQDFQHMLWKVSLYFLNFNKPSVHFYLILS